MTNAPIGVPSGWEISAAFYWTGSDAVFHISNDLGKANWADYCEPEDDCDWRVEG